MVVLMKIGETQALSGFIKSFITTAYQSGGIVRNIKNLGDRLAAREYKAKDGSRQDFVRYLAFEFDSDPSTMRILMSQARTGDDTLSVHTHKLNLNTYYKNMLDTEYFKKFENKETDQGLKNDFIVKNTAKEILKKIKEEGKPEDEVMMDFGIKNEISKSSLI